MSRYYLNNSVLLDYYEKRGSRGVMAKKFLTKAIKENALIGYSDLTLIELRNVGYGKFEISNILKTAKAKKTRRLHISRGQLEEATRVAKQRGVPRKDVLHAILCRDNEFQLISNDRHFELLKDITECKRPENFI